MSAAIPLYLLLLIPLAGAAWALTRRMGPAANRLPGGWNALVAPQLKAYLAQRSAARRNRMPILLLGVAAVIVLALTRPGFHHGRELDLTGVAGRVIVMDATTDIARQALFLRELQDATPRVPTAVIAAAGDAYVIAPFTTDPAQIHRYLNVLVPDMMPGEGRRLHLGLARAEALLNRAGYLAGQVILTAEAPPPAPVPIAPSESLRVVVALGQGDWSAFADSYGAALRDGAAAARASNDLIELAETAARDSLPGARLDLSPWLIGGAMALWLVLFRRRLS